MKRNADRDFDIRCARAGGMTLQDIAARYNVSRERIRQICDGIPRPERPVSRVKDTRQEVREARCVARYGCTNAERMRLARLGVTRAWREHKNNCKRDGISFEMKLYDWWRAWLASGHWEDRGVGRGYTMSRLDKSGAICVGNIRIERHDVIAREAIARTRAAGRLP